MGHIFQKYIKCFALTLTLFGFLKTYAENPELLSDFGNGGMGSEGVLIDTSWVLTGKNPLDLTHVLINGKQYKILGYKSLQSTALNPRHKYTSDYAHLLYLDQPVLDTPVIKRVRVAKEFRFPIDQTYYVTTMNPLQVAEASNSKVLNFPERFALKFEGGADWDKKKAEAASFWGDMKIPGSYVGKPGLTYGYTSLNPFYVFVQNASGEYEFVGIREDQLQFGSSGLKQVGLGKKDNNYYPAPFSPEVNTEIDNIILAQALAQPKMVGKHLILAKVYDKSTTSNIAREKGMSFWGALIDSSWLLSLARLNSSSLLDSAGIREISLGEKESLVLTPRFAPTIHVTPIQRLHTSSNYLFSKGANFFVISKKSDQTLQSFLVSSQKELNFDELITDLKAGVTDKSISSIYLYDQKGKKWILVGFLNHGKGILLDQNVNTQIDNAIIERALNNQGYLEND